MARDIIEKNLSGLKKGDKGYHFYKLNLGDVYNNEGYYLQERSDYRGAIVLYEKSLEIYLEFNNSDGIATAWNNLGLCYERLGDLKLALDYFHKSLKHSEKTNDPTIGNALVNIGTIHDGLGESNLAISNYRRALDIYRKNGDHRGLGTVYNLLAQQYYYKSDSLAALEHYALGEKELLKVNDLTKLAGTYNGLANVLLWMGRKDDALKNYEKALGLYREIGETDGEARLLINIARLIRKYGDKKSPVVLGNAELAMKLAKKSGTATILQQAASLLKAVYSDNGRYKEAFEMSRLHKQMEDSLGNDENKKASLRQQFQYEYEKKAAADSVRVAEERKLAEIELDQEQTQRYALYGGLAIVSVFAFFVFRKLKESQAQKRIIEEQKHMVEEKQKELLDSIYYAKRIQRALITPEKFIERKLRELKK